MAAGRFQVGDHCFATCGEPGATDEYLYLYPATVVDVDAHNTISRLSWWDEDTENTTSPFARVRKGLLLLTDVIEVLHSGIWCGGKVTDTDYFDHKSNLKPKHELAVTLKVYKQRRETHDLVLGDYMFGAGGENKIRVLVRNK